MSLPIRVVVHKLVRYPNASGPRRSNFTKRRRWVSPRRRGRPGENRTRNACSPPRWRESRQRMTELGSHGMRRPTSLSEYPSSSNFKARLRRSSSRSALPLGLGIGAPPEHLLLHFLRPTLHYLCTDQIALGITRLGCSGFAFGGPLHHAEHRIAQHEHSQRQRHIVAVGRDRADEKQNGSAKRDSGRPRIAPRAIRAVHLRLI